MTLCPIALVAGCKKCPAFSVCLLKGVIGDYKKEEASDIRPPAETLSQPDFGCRPRLFEDRPSGST